MVSDRLQTLSHKKTRPYELNKFGRNVFYDYMSAYRCCYISISNRKQRQDLIIDLYHPRPKSYINKSFQYIYFNFVQFCSVHLRYRKIACQIILINKTYFHFLDEEYPCVLKKITDVTRISWYRHCLFSLLKPIYILHQRAVFTVPL